MALTVGELLAIVRLDKRGYDRGIDQAEAKLLGFSRDARGRLHDLQGRFVREGRESGEGLADGIGNGAESARRALLPLAGLLLRGAGMLVFRAAVAGAAVNVLHFVGTLAPLLGLLVGLPALLIAGAGALAAFKIGLSGVGKAIKGDEDALAALAPQARQVVNEIRALDGAWQQVRQTVQGAMFAPLRGEVTALARTWLPILRTQLGGVAAEFGLMGQSAATAARDPGFTSGITAALVWLRQVLAANRGAVGDLVAAFGTVVGAIAPILGTGDGFADMAASLREWVTAAAASGQLADIWQTAVGVLKQLGGLLVQVGGIFAAVFGAAQQEGGGTLGVLTDVLRTLNGFLSVGPGRDALVLIFRTLHQVVQALMPAVQVLGGALVQAITPLLPALVPLAGVLAQVVTALAPLLPVVGQLAGLVAGLLVMALQNLLSILSPIISVLVGSLQPVIPMLAAAFAEWMGAVAPLAQQLGILASQALAELLPTLLQLVPTLIHDLLPAFTAILGAVLQLLPALLPMIPAWMQLAVAVTPLIGLLAQLVAKILGALIPVLLPLISVLVKLATQGIGRTAAAVTWLMNNALRPLFGVLGEFIGWLGKVLTKVSTFVAGLLDKFGELPGKVRGFFSDAGSWLLDAGRKIIDGLIRGIEAGFDKVKGTLGKLTGLLPDWKGPRERDRKLLQPAGRLIMGGLLTGLRREVPEVRRLLAGLTGELGALTPAAVGGYRGMAAPVSNSVTYTTNLYPQRVDFTLADLAQHQHTLAVRARARRAW